ncbi:hypothetical protein [Paenibacillus sp. 481]|nr:hypothetical protein [Paenibacillus sp. 481]UHA76308.1 hypothetical protein KIK04_05540 [Paenibacillus sp. 481]
MMRVCLLSLLLLLALFFGDALVNSQVNVVEMGVTSIKLADNGVGGYQ